jgi:multidrug resistance efflux pump
MKFKELLVNAIYFIVIFVFTLLVSTQSLARKVNTLQTMTSPIFFYVDKQDIAVVSTVSGRVKEVMVTPGQHVDKGELLMTIDMSEYNKKIQALEGVARNNLSAKTELNMLKEQKDFFNVYAPQNGVVYKIQTAEGSYVSAGLEVAVIFADKDARLLTYVTPAQYTELQNKDKINVYSKRLEQSFEVKISGIGRVTTDYQTSNNKFAKKIRKYELVFRFANPENGAVFIEQESLQLVNTTNTVDIQRPIERVARLWNALILGK